MDARSAGLLVAGIGLVVVFVGLLIAAGALSWFGRLPGDIRWQSGNTTVYVPITTMLLVSIALSLASVLVRRFL